MRYAIKIIAVVECANDSEARHAAAEIASQLAKPYVKVLLSSGGVKLVGSRVDPKPAPER